MHTFTRSQSFASDRITLNVNTPGKLVLKITSAFRKVERNVPKYTVRKPDVALTGWLDY